MATQAPSLPAPDFVGDADGLDPNLILADMIAAFESAAQRRLRPAQVERLLINLYAYRESLIRNAIQYAAEQNLLAFARFPMIDYLGGLLGVVRLAAQPASTTLEFTLQSSLSVPFTIAAGARVGTEDGRFVFATDASLTIEAGTLTASVTASATVAGAEGNGYLPGQVSILLEPDSQIAGVANTDATAGGAEPETDEHLRQRIQAAPNEFSVAGPTGAYRFFALGADSSIVDAQVTSPAPGQVNVYILTGPITTQPAPAPNSQGIADAAVLQKVVNALDGDSVRPLTDSVIALAVTEVDYEITGTISVFSDADLSTTMASALAAAEQFAINLASRIQRDIVPSEVVAALSVPGVYEVSLTAPGFTALSPGQWANCTAITLGQAVSSEHS